MPLVAHYLNLKLVHLIILQSLFGVLFFYLTYKVSLSFSNDIIFSSKTILWNGPMGVFEQEPYAAGTKAIAEKLVEATETGQTTIVGGGDTAAAIRAYGYHHDVTHVSTGGGASLELLSGETLPAFSALESK